ncbi:hypothetical protein GGS26DRAFT_599344 [Hypomontagnella submonticulosa]|nr:hypothetical protein GGS26DRAFT_599344 [Hypomontagnella submonticulosa]
MAGPLQTFSLFPNLPLELRRMIWAECIPRRIVEIEPELRSWPKYKEIQSSNPPLIARVCRESRDIARLFGSIEYPRSLNMPIWVDHGHDIAILNNRYLLDCYIYDEDHADPGIRKLVNSSDIPISIGHELVVHDGPRADSRTMWVLDRLAGRKTCSVVLFDMTIHLTHREAIDSDLFGLFAEETTIHIGIKDGKQLARLFDTYETAFVPKGMPDLSALRKYLSGDEISTHIFCFLQFTKVFWLQRNKILHLDADPLDYDFEDPLPPGWQHLLDQLPEFNFVVAIHLREWGRRQMY